MPKNKSENKSRIIVAKGRRSPLSTARFSLLTAIVALGLVALSPLVANIQTTQNLTVSAQSILGDDEKSEEQKKAEEAQKETDKQVEERLKEQQEQQKEAEKKAAEDAWRPSRMSGRSTKSKTETISPSGLKIKTESEGNKQETEIKTADGQKIKTTIEDDGTTKIEIKNGTVKLKYRVENGKLVLKVENDEGEEVEIEDDELEELEDAVEDELDDDDVKLAPTTNNKLAVTKNQVAAVTDFPLSINVETRELIVTTPAGQKVVAILPDQAVENLLATGIINRVETPPADTIIQDQLGTLTGVVRLEIRNGEIVYSVDGVKTHRMFGFIPVNTPTTAFVSADNGTVVAQERSIIANIVDILSI